MMMAEMAEAQAPSMKSATRTWPSLTAALALLLAALLWTASVAAETSVRASVDRNEVALDETFTLSLIADSMLFSSEPDISALDKDFRVISRQQSSQTNIVNGDITSSRRWDYVLAPRRQGTLTIPAIPMGKYQTRPLTISVSDQPQRRPAGRDSFFIESDITPRRAYVQSQLHYTVKIFTAVNFLDASLEPLEVDNAVVEGGSDRRYNTQIDGRYYRVIERRYSIYPQASGELEIPALTFQARVEGYRQSLLDPGKLVIKRSREHRVTVLPPPAEFSGPVWLPARQLNLSQHWSSDPTALKVGDSITRTVSLQADGLLGSQLPALPATELAGAKLYPDKAKIENGDEQSPWTGVRSEATAIIPTAPGEFLLPEIRIPWWNTETQQMEVAVLPEFRFSVAPAAGSAADTAATSGGPTAARSGNGAQVGASASRDGATDTVTVYRRDPLLLGAIALLLVSNLLFALAWLRSRQGRQQIAAAASLSGEAQPATTERDAFNALKSACAQNADAAELRRHLLSWGAAYCGHPVTLTELGERVPELATLGRALDAQLYGSGGAAIDSRALLAAVSERRKTPYSTTTGKNETLQPLYPAS